MNLTHPRTTRLAGRLILLGGLLSTVACERETLLCASAASRWTSPPVFTELWRAGGTRPGEALALPAAVAVGPRGYAAIPDFQLGEVLVVAPDGGWLGSWTRVGSGPGEVRTPIAAAWDPGGTLAVWDVVGSRVVRLKDGAPVGDLVVDPAFSSAVVASGQVLWAAVGADGAVLTKRRLPAGGERDGLQPRTEVILRLPAGEEDPDTLARAEVLMLTGELAGRLRPGATGLLAASSSTGALAVADSAGAYRIRLRLPDGSRRPICRDTPAPPLSPAERGEGADASLARLAGALREATPVAEPQPFGRLFFDAEDRLWVQRERPSPLDPWDGLYGVAGARYDVFSREGEYLGEVRAPDGARLQGALGDTVWALELGELDAAWLVAYRMASE